MKKPQFPLFPPLPRRSRTQAGVHSPSPVQCSKFSGSTVRRFTPTRFNAFTLLTLLTLLTLPLCGCQTLTYTGPNGEHFTRSSFASKTAISSLSLEATTNGVRKVQLKGYQNDSTAALGAVTEAAVRAALDSAK